MKIELFFIGKTNKKYLNEGISIYEQRLKHYVPLVIKEIPEPKLKTGNAIKIKELEGEAILRAMSKSDYIILLDEKGEHFSSTGFAKHMQSIMNRGTRNLAFVVGGAYGFSEAVYKKAHARLSLSKMTYSHQLIRLVFLEQLYRCMTILRNEPYHNDYEYLLLKESSLYSEKKLIFTILSQFNEIIKIHIRNNNSVSFRHLC